MKLSCASALVASRLPSMAPEPLAPQDSLTVSLSDGFAIIADCGRNSIFLTTSACSTYI
jgi:hypothetical protein